MKVTVKEVMGLIYGMIISRIRNYSQRILREFQDEKDELLVRVCNLPFEIALVCEEWKVVNVAPIFFFKSLQNKC